MDTLTQESRHLYFHEMWINYLNLVRDLLSPKSVIHYQQEFKNFCMWTRRTLFEAIRSCEEALDLAGAPSYWVNFMNFGSLY